MKKVSTEQEFRSVVAEPGTTVAVFKAVWCKDCHFIEPFMPDLKVQYKDSIRFIEVDRDELPDMCSELNILGIPSFIAFSNGQELIRFVSKLRKTKEEIKQFLDRAVDVSSALNNK
jgi:thioredoxin-like negative regulator of GroEL